MYIAFIEKGSSLLRKNGTLSFIIPFAYTIQNYGESSREMLLKNFNIDEIIDTSNYLVFDTAMVKNIILRFSNKSNLHHTKIRIVDSAKNFNMQKFNDSIIDQEIFNTIPGKQFKTNGFQNGIELKNKIEKMSVPLETICFIAYGVRINNRTDKTKPKSYYLRNNYSEGLKPFIEGRNIQRYHHEQNGWLQYTPSEHYNPMFPELFENEKLIFINVVSERLRFSYDDECLYNSHTVINCVRLDHLLHATHRSAKKACKDCSDFNFVAQYDMKFILGILNSKLINWYFLTYSSDGLHIYPDNAKQLPIINLKLKNVNQTLIIDLVDKIISAKKNEIETSSLEKSLDSLIYSLYDLTEEEIKTIEESSNN